MVEILRIIDPRGKTVILSIEQWENHILDEHQDMIDELPEIENTIKNPYLGLIFSDVLKDYRNIYYRKQNESYYIKVVVDFAVDGVGAIVTAFRADSCKKGEKLIWTQLNN